MACFSESGKIPSLNDALHNLRQYLDQEWQQLLHKPRWSWVKTTVLRWSFGHDFIISSAVTSSNVDSVVHGVTTGS